IKIGPEAMAVMASAIEAQRSKHPDVLIHTWALWPERLDVLVDGPRVSRNRALGYLKSRLSRAYQVGVEPSYTSVWGSETWGVELYTAAERLRCLNFLRQQMLVVQ